VKATTAPQPRRAHLSLLISSKKKAQVGISKIINRTSLDMSYSRLIKVNIKEEKEIK